MSGPPADGAVVTLDYDDDQTAFADAVSAFCRDAGTATGGDVPDDLGPDPLRPDHLGPDDLGPDHLRPDHLREVWRGLAALGVLGLGTPEGGGGALEIAAVMERLGAALCPGPLVPTFLAAPLLPDALRAGVVAGERWVAVQHRAALVPWAPLADHFVVVDEEGTAWLAAPAGPVTPVATMGGEPWGRVELVPGTRLGDGRRAAAVADVALAAYLAGAAAALVAATADYAANRSQFGRPIGSFQAVAHPIAAAGAGADGARDLARVAAHHLDHAPDGGEGRGRVLAASARLAAATAALEAAAVCHQASGALGYTEEAQVGRFSRRARQWSLLPPGPDAARKVVLGGLLPDEGQGGRAALPPPVWEPISRS